MQEPDLIQFNTGANQANRVAIVFVHGFSGDLRGTWGNIPTLLQSSGMLPGWDLYGFGYPSTRWIDLLGLWSADPDLERISDRLFTKLEPMMARYKFAFVAHSMGGLVVQRALISRQQLREATTHVTLFGTPSNGLEKARPPISWLKQQASNMAKGGPFVTALRTDWNSLHWNSDRPFKFLTVAGEMDQFVDPGSSLDPFPKEVQRVIPGNHISMLKADAVDAPSVQMILQNITANAAGIGVRSAASVAVDAGDFQQVINRLSDNRDKLDDRGAVQLAIALDGVGKSEDAISLLRLHKGLGTDVLGVLAGRLKRRWWMTSSLDDFNSALDLYRKGYETAVAKNDCEQAYYHAINVAYMLLAGSNSDVPGAKAMAQDALVHCSKSSNDSHWRLATEGDALVILGQTQAGFEKHRQAAAKPEVRAWEALSMEEQAIRVAQLAGVSRADGAKLAAIYESS